MRSPSNAKEEEVPAPVKEEPVTGEEKSTTKLPKVWIKVETVRSQPKFNANFLFSPQQQALKQWFDAETTIRPTQESRNVENVDLLLASQEQSLKQAFVEVSEVKFFTVMQRSFYQNNNCLCIEEVFPPYRQPSTSGSIACLNFVGVKFSDNKFFFVFWELIQSFA